MKLPDEHGGAKVNGSVQLELRDVATGVSAAAWQLACEGVRAREHARAPFGQEEQGSTPAGAVPRAVPRAVSTSPHTGVGVPVVGQSKTRSMTRDARALIG
jgi:hypothetical protein